MTKRTEHGTNVERRFTGINGLCDHSGLGATSARKLANQFGLGIKVGGRILYDLKEFDECMTKLRLKQNNLVAEA